MEQKTNRDLVKGREYYILYNGNKGNTIDAFTYLGKDKDGQFNFELQVDAGIHCMKVKYSLKPSEFKIADISNNPKFKNVYYYGTEK